MKFIDASDLINTAAFAMTAPVAWVAGERQWPALARGFAKAHVALRGPAHRHLDGHPALVVLGRTPRTLEQDAMAETYLETMQVLREHRPGGWSAEMAVEGREHIDEALAAGRGAVLWIASMNCGELVVKKALARTGYAVTNLRSHVHPYSGTRFGRAVLNRIRTSVEDRYLDDTVTLGPNGQVAAMLELKLRLAANAVVTITANSAGERPLRVPFHGGTLNLALGAAALARIGRAPLLPVFAARAAGRRHTVTIQSPLTPGPDDRGRQFDEAMGRAFAGRLASFVREYPAQFRGWFNRYQWNPEPPAS